MATWIYYSVRPEPVEGIRFRDLARTLRQAQGEREEIYLIFRITDTAMRRRILVGAQFIAPVFIPA